MGFLPSFSCFSFLLDPLKLRLANNVAYMGRGDKPRGPFFLDEDIVERHEANIPFLAYSPRFRLEYALAFSELFLLRDDAIVSSYMSQTPLTDLRDPWKVVKAHLVCPDLDDPIQEIDKMSRLRALSFRDLYRTQGMNV